jgi:hypothetical protein
MHATTTQPTRLAELALTAAIVELTLTTAYIHLTLGGILFTLNALGYAGLAALVAATALPHPVIRRFAWLPLVALAGFTTVTIGAYLVIGPYFALGWVAKGVEVAILTLIVADLVLRYGSLREVVDSFRPGDRRGSMPA